MIPDIEKIEHLLHAKAFAELTATERELVLAHLSGEAEYEHMRETLFRVKKVFTEEAAAVQAEMDMKELVLARFAQNKTVKPSLSERIAAFVQQLFPSPFGRFSLALGSLLLVVFTAYVFWPSPQAEMAVNALPEPTYPSLRDEKIESVPSIGLTEERAEPAVKSENPVRVQPQGAVQEQSPVAEMNQVDMAVAEDMVDEPLAATQKPSPKEAEIVYQEPPVYKDNDGFSHYMNSRVAEAPTVFKKSEGSGAKLAEKEMVVKAKDNQAAEEMDNKVMANKSVSTTGTARGVLANGRDDENMLIPVWPGLESSVNAYELTSQKILLFLKDDHNLDVLSKPKQLELILRFNEQGTVVSALVKGDLSAELKKEIQQKALGLPRFAFSKGTSAKALSQRYVLVF